MEFLKYLDVLIGLALIMVLLSPLVTGVTHFAMWLRNRRSVFLLQAIERLILQLEPGRACALRVWDAGGTPAAGVSVGTLGTTDATGALSLPTGVVTDASTTLTIPVQLTSQGGKPLAGGHVALAPSQTAPASHQAPPNERGVVRVQADAGGMAQLQVKPGHACALRVWDTAGTPLAGVLVGTLGTTDATGGLSLPTGVGIPVELTSQGTPLAGRHVALARGQTAPASHLASANELSVVRVQADAMGTAQLREPPVIITTPIASEISTKVAEHPMVARSSVNKALVKVPPFKNRRAEVIEREELIRILLELAVGEHACVCQLTRTSEKALLTVLALNGIADPAARLEAIRIKAQELEKEKPELALHVRHAKAIADVPTAFVGKITQWFDAAMARATQQYAAEARFWTVLGAFIVAVALQFDSLDLLQRLSSDSALRSTLVGEATAHQQRLDTLAEKPATSASTLESARAKHQEIQQSLTMLRKPELAILPDHFIWDGVPQARLVRNPLWRAPYPESLELVAGGGTYALKPRWRRDPLVDIQQAIEASGAPVDVALRPVSEAVGIRADEPLEIVTTPAQSGVSLTELTSVAEAVLRLKGDGEWPAVFDLKARPLTLRWEVLAKDVLKQEELRLTRVEPIQRRDLPAAIAGLLLGQTRFDVTCRGADEKSVECAKAYGEPPKSDAKDAPGGARTPLLIVTARRGDVRDIRLLWDRSDPFTNVLDDVTRRARAWRVTADPSPESATGSLAALTSWLVAHAAAPAPPTLYLFRDISGVEPEPPAQASECTPRDTGSVCTLSAATLQNALIRPDVLPRGVRIVSADELVLTSRRLGPLQLRYEPGRSDTNVLESRIAHRWTGWPLLQSRSLLGLLLSWVLLSLGAPFWFDTLKNLLKLRPPAAVQEEKNKNDRVTQNAPAK